MAYPTITKIDLVTVGKVPGIDEPTFRDHASAAKAGCPVSRALAGVPEITLDASLVAVTDAFILGGVRTPFGRYGGSLSHIRTDDLLGQTMVAACERVGVPLDRIEDIAAGCVNAAHEGMGDIARWGALAAGFPDSVPAVDRQSVLRLVADRGDQHRPRHPQRRARASGSPAGSSRCPARAGRT